MGGTFPSWKVDSAAAATADADAAPGAAQAPPESTLARWHAEVCKYEQEHAGFVAHPSEAVRAIVGKAGIEFKQTWEPSAMKRKNAKTPGDQTLDLALRGA